MRTENLRITCSAIQRRALELAQEQGNEEFLASRGWLQKFFKRYCLSIRRRTTVSQRLPAELVPRVVSFIIKTRKLRMMRNYSLSNIGNMDETSLWLDMPGETTVSRTGERTISIGTTSHNKGRFTVILAAMADGRKLKPYVVFKGVQPVAALMAIPGVVVAFSKNGWMNEDLTIDWVTKVWGALNFQRRLLVWDAYRCHLMSSVSSHVEKSTNSDINVIPGGLTGHLQPADVSWNKPFKEAYKVLYNEWMVSGQKSYTPACNMRAPDKTLCLQWVKEAWKSVTQKVVKKSFLVCGISVNTDGSQDSEVSCLKQGGIATEASATIAEKTMELNSHTQCETEDPFADLEDEDEVVHNELAIEED